MSVAVTLVYSHTTHLVTVPQSTHHLKQFFRGKLLLPINADLYKGQPQVNPGELDEDDIEQLEKRREMIEKVKRNILDAQEKQRRCTIRSMQI